MDVVVATPTERTLAHLRDMGFRVKIVETWNSFTKTRHDMEGFIDILAWRLDPRTSEPEMIAIQCTTRPNHLARKKKILTDPKVAPRAKDWLAHSWKIWVMSWNKTMRNKQPRYDVKLEELFVHDFERGEVLCTKETMGGEMTRT